VRFFDEHNLTLVDLVVKLIYPFFGDTRGGTLVFVNLEDFGSSLVSHCIFGGHVVPAISLDEVLVCETPVVVETGPLKLGLRIPNKFLHV
jgi:hypothetical protein